MNHHDPTQPPPPAASAADQTGDPDATEQIWNDFGDRLRAFIRSRIRDDHAAADILQETFVRIHARLETLEDSQRLGGWVFQIARNAIVDHARKNQRQAMRDAAAQPAEPPSDDTTNDVVASWLPLMIEDLPESYRDAVRMFELEGKSQRAIAEALGLSLSSAKSRVQRGRSMLKKELHRCCSFELDGRGNVVGYASNDEEGCRVCAPPEREGSDGSTGCGCDSPSG